MSGAARRRFAGPSGSDDRLQRNPDSDNDCIVLWKDIRVGARPEPLAVEAATFGQIKNLFR